jgi:hypothetical protein
MYTPAPPILYWCHCDAARSGSNLVAAHRSQAKRRKVKERSIMNMRLFGKAILYAGAILVFGAMALAQSTKGSNPPPPKKDAPSTQPADRESGAVIAADFKAAGQSSTPRGRDIPSVSEVTVSAKTSGQGSSDREGGGPIISEVTATDKTNEPAPSFPSFKSMGSAHATEAVAPLPHQDKNELDQLYDKNPNPSSTSQDKAGVNPFYEDNSHQGTNPLFEGRDKDAAAAAPKPSNQAHSHETVEYKDPEDMTTRYRPGNNKTTKDSNPPQKSGTPSKQ